MDSLRQLFQQRKTRRHQRGASMVEFVIVTPLLMFMGLGIMQFGLIYHAKSMLNYATFEAARAGAVSNGQKEVMRKELGYRLAPVYGGDGTLRTGVMAVTRATVAANDITATKIDILNPLPASFSEHGESKSVVDRHGAAHQVLAIQNSHLRIKPREAGDDGLTVQDANLLKIEVTYGYQMRLPFLDMELPGVSWTLRNVMMRNDPDNWMYYIRGMIPLKSTATVRMQSESWDWQEQPIAVRAFDATYQWIQDQITGQDDDPNNPNDPDNLNDPNDPSDPNDPNDPNNDDADDNTDDVADDTEPLECEGDTVEESSDEELEDDPGIIGSIWNSVKDALGAAYDFVRGFWEGVKTQVSDLAAMIAHPIQTAEGLIALGKAFLDEPEKTLAAIGEAIGQDLSRLANCGAYVRGKIIGENVNPIFMLKLANKLVKFNGDIDLAVAETKLDFGCASFVGGTMVWTPDGFAPIESLEIGQLVHSRNADNYKNKPQLITNLFGRIATEHYQLTTENDELSLTAEHPLWVQGDGWVKAREVQHGDVLATADGDTLVLGNNRVAKPVTVYNFSVENTPNYFVGSERLWVHNASTRCRLPWVQALDDYPDVSLRPIDPADLFTGQTGTQSSGLRDALKHEYPDLEQYTTGPAKWQAHHIIPWNTSHALLDRLNFDKNSIHNGIPLPTDRNAPSTAHSGRHKQVYDDAIRDFLDDIEDLNISDSAKAQVLVDGIENLRQAFANKQVNLNGDPDLTQKQYDDILESAIQAAPDG